MKFKKGDLVTVLDSPDLLASQKRHVGNTYEVISYDKRSMGALYRLGTGDATAGFYEHELEFAAIHNSPLYKALS